MMRDGHKIVEIENLSFTYPDGHMVLRDVNVTVWQGEVVAVLGSNGAGKSTLLLHLNGILRGDGAVSIMGLPAIEKNLKEIRRRVGLIFQEPDDQLFSPTVFDDVAFGPLNMRCPEDEVRRRVGRALQLVGMSGYEQRSPHHLSVGEKKRIAIATVLSMDPEILVFDEPTANLDPRSRADLIDMMRRLNKEGRTIVIATHDVDAVAEIASRVYVLNRGIVAEGTVGEIFSNMELLRGNNLKVPEIARLFEVLRCFGYDCDELPLSIEEAVDHLTRTIEQDGKHVHLHIHEHTHEELARLLGSRHNHHPQELK